MHAFLRQWCAVLCPWCLRMWQRIKPRDTFRMFLDCTIAAEVGVGPYLAHRGVDALVDQPLNATNTFGLAVLARYPWPSLGFAVLGLVHTVLFLLTYRRVHRRPLRIARRITSACCAIVLGWYGLSLFGSPFHFEAIHSNALVWLSWAALLTLAAVEDGGDVQ